MSDDKKSAEKVRATTGDTQYDYVDNTVEAGAAVTPHQTRGAEATQAELNPAFYPKQNKPEALHNEAEKAGADYPGGGQLQAALHANSDEDLDPKDPEVANPPAPAPTMAGSGVSAADQSTGAGQREGSDRKEATKKTAAKRTGAKTGAESKDSSDSNK